MLAIGLGIQCVRAGEWCQIGWCRTLSLSLSHFVGYEFRDESHAPKTQAWVFYFLILFITFDLGFECG